MKRTHSAILLLIVAGLSAYSQTVPSLINYQGRLTDQTGAPLTPGAYGLQFRLWDSSTATGAGDLIWAEQSSVTIQSNGAFNAILGSGSSITGVTAPVTNLAFAFGGNGCYLGVTVASSNGVPIAGAGEILPRQQLLSVPFAVQALQAQQAQVAQQTIVATNLAASLANALCPAGSIMAFGGASVPSGWLLCDGSTVSRAVYPNLFAAIGSAWGRGDGSTTFVLPDLRGLFLRGVNGSQSNTNYWDPDVGSRTNLYVGQNIGNAVGSLQTDMFRSHVHKANSQFVEYPGGGNNGWVSAGPSIIYTPATLSAGGNETRPVNAYVNYIIKY